MKLTNKLLCEIVLEQRKNKKATGIWAERLEMNPQKLRAIIRAFTLSGKAPDHDRDMIDIFLQMSAEGMTEAQIARETGHNINYVISILRPTNKEPVRVKENLQAPTPVYLLDGSGINFLPTQNTIYSLIGSRL